MYATDAQTRVEWCDHRYVPPKSLASTYERPGARQDALCGCPVYIYGDMMSYIMVSTQPLVAAPRGQRQKPRHEDGYPRWPSQATHGRREERYRDCRAGYG